LIALYLRVAFVVLHFGSHFQIKNNTNSEYVELLIGLWLCVVMLFVVLHF